MAQYNVEQVEKYGTGKNQITDFPVGTKVKVICGMQDFRAFDGETGVVVRNNGGYIGIIVLLEDGSEFNFDPQDLIITEGAEYKCTRCGHSGIIKV